MATLSQALGLAGWLPSHLGVCSPWRVCAIGHEEEKVTRRSFLLGKAFMRLHFHHYTQIRVTVSIKERKKGWELIKIQLQRSVGCHSLSRSTFEKSQHSHFSQAFRVSNYLVAEMFQLLLESYVDSFLFSCDHLPLHRNAPAHPYSCAQKKQRMRC